MDFKVAGTRNGITALQMDIKIGDHRQIMREALEQARRGRLFLLIPWMLRSAPRTEKQVRAADSHAADSTTRFAI